MQCHSAEDHNLKYTRLIQLYSSSINIFRNDYYECNTHRSTAHNKKNLIYILLILEDGTK